MPTETRIFALKSDGSVSNQGPSTIRSVPKCTTTAWDASINGDDSDEEIGDWIYRSSDTAKAVADAQKAADALTEKCEHSANQNQTSNSPRHSSILNGSGTISKGADLGQKDGARQKSAVPTKRTIPAEGGDDSTPPKRSRGSPCSEEGCTNKAQSRGVCGRHGGVPTCNEEGCTNKAQSRGLCGRHGGVPTCSEEGCTNKAQSRGVCGRHGGVPTCCEEGCTNYAIKGGVCVRHGANRTSKTCSHDGCTNYPRKGGVCIRHGAKPGATRKSCSEEGCASIAQKGGVCWRHGANRTSKTCSHEGCTNISQKGGACKRHRGKMKDVPAKARKKEGQFKSTK